MTQLLTQNALIKQSGRDDGYLIFNFGIPALQSKETGMITCPNAGECAEFCYAKKGAYVWSNVNQAFEKRLALTLTDDFIPVMSAAIDKKRQLAKRRDLTLAIRIHDSGDFYNKGYLAKWFSIMAAFPDVQFYAFTKQIMMLKQAAKPENFIVIYSYGSKTDHRIDPDKDRHSRIFRNRDELLAADYCDTSNDDAKAFLCDGKVGLIHH